MYSLGIKDTIQANFRKIWMEDYLLSLRKMHRHVPSSNLEQPYLKVGSIVLLNNSSKPRVSWFMVKIIEILRSEDNNVRVVRIQRADKSTTAAHVSKLYPLELVAVSTHAPSLEEEFVEGVDYEKVPSSNISEEEIPSDAESCVIEISETEVPVTLTDSTVDTGSIVLEDQEVLPGLPPIASIDLSTYDDLFASGGESNSGKPLKRIPKENPLSHTNMRPSRKAAECCKAFLKECHDSGDL